MSDVIEKLNLSPIQDDDIEGRALLSDKYLSIVGGVDLKLSVEVGQATLSINDLQQLKENQIVALDQNVNDAVTLILNNKKIATGELVVSGDKYAVLIKKLFLET